MPTDDAERSSGAWRDADVQQAAFPLEPIAARASDSGGGVQRSSEASGLFCCVCGAAVRTQLGDFDTSPINGMLHSA